MADFPSFSPDFSFSMFFAAEDLFVHKNTVQYRLNKLRDITGLDPRNVEDFIRLYLAFILN